MRYVKKGLFCLTFCTLLLLVPVSTFAVIDFTGLWVAQVEVDQVTYINDATAEKSTNAPMALKLILHQNSGGTVKLLRAVVLMWKDGTLNADGTVATPGKYVLVNDPTKIPDFKGVALRDGKPVARRISSSNYDFAGNELTCTGSIGSSGSVVCNITVGSDLPTNPFLHRYHPQHDNQNATYNDAVTDEVSAFTRTMTLTFITPSNASPAWGSSQLSGTYAETLTGLNTVPLGVAGTFSLVRASKTGEMNQ